MRVELVQKEDGYYLDTNVYELIEGFKNRMIDSDVLGKAFEPEERFENPPLRLLFPRSEIWRHLPLNVITK